jgi:hypothetical protein
LDIHEDICISSIRWLKKQPLSIARCHGQLVTNSHSIYSIGGCTEAKENRDDKNNTNNPIMFSLNLLDRYNAREDQWISQPHMNQARHDLCAEIIGIIFLLNILFQNYVYNIYR